MFKEHMEKFDPKRWEASIASKKQMSVFIASSYEPDKNVLDMIKRSNDIGIFIGNPNDVVSVKPCENPDENDSVGYASVFAAVS
jgi:hypothetical protein